MLSRLFSSVFPKDIPPVAERMAARATDFQCISLIPYQAPNGAIDRYRPFQFPAMIRPIAEAGPVDRAVWKVAKISCADDICVQAIQAAYAVEIKAAGLEGTTRTAFLEAARAPEAEACRYIVFQHPLQQHKHNGLNSIVLENTAAPAESDRALVVSMVGRRPS